MLLSKLQTQNFAGLPAFTVDFAPLTLFAGQNGSGKSTIRDAIAFVLTGNGVRGIKQVNQYDRLLTHGAEKGWAEATLDGRVIRRSITTGKIGTVAVPPTPECLPFILDPARFAGLEPAEKRNALRELLGVKATVDHVADRLKQAGLPESVVIALRPYIVKGGFEGGEKQARTFATEARGAWKAITGQVYGSKVAEDWAPTPLEGVPGPEEVLATLDAKRAVEAQIAGLHQAIGAASRQIPADKRALAQAWAAKLPDYEASQARGRAKREELLAQITHLGPLAAGQSGTTTPCPHCQQPVIIDRGHLRAPVEVDQVAMMQASESVATARTELATLDASLQSLADNIATARNHKALLDAAGDGEPTDVAALQKEVETKSRRQSDLATLANIQRDRVAEADRIAGNAEKAQAEHQNVGYYTTAADQLSPNGIPATLLAAVLGPFNELLAEAADACDWPAVTLDAGMALAYGPTDYVLASESQQWRVNAAVAYAFAKASQYRILIFDRWDVLDVPSRGTLMKWLMGLTQGGDWQVILSGTLKALPAAPPGARFVWLEPEAVGVAA
jgi:energy-coupling factor transporter ATP-binding protein EcfA2